MTNRSNIWSYSALVLVGAGFVCALWAHRSFETRPGTRAVLSAALPAVPNAQPTSSSVRPSSMQPSTTGDRDIREEFTNAKDYAVYARSIRPEAEAGKPEAQYFLSETLRYCEQNLSRFFFVSGKRARTLNEAQVRWANRPAGYQQEITEIYSRCHTFLEEDNARLSEWHEWLDEASDGHYPLAQAMKADLTRQDAMVAALSGNPTADPEATTKARALALEALRSRDADVVWRMSDFVDETSVSTNGVLPTAWMLLACDRGYDCSAQAEWLRTACNFDLQCNPGDTGQQYLARQLGNNLDEAKRTASEIGAVLDAGDWGKVPVYLSAKDYLSAKN